MVPQFLDFCFFDYKITVFFKKTTEYYHFEQKN